jgi:hypothetical protein
MGSTRMSSLQHRCEQNLIRRDESSFDASFQHPYRLISSDADLPR